MAFDLLLLLLAASALIGVAGIIIRKFPALVRLKPESVKEHQESRLKELLIEDRLRRKAGMFWKALGGRVQPFFQVVARRAIRRYHKILELEREYRKKNLQREGKSMHALRHVHALLDEARALCEQEEFPEAEQKCIEAIALDPKKEEAYELLGEVYMEQKEYASARETFEHVVKLKQRAVERGMQEEAELSTAYLDLCLSLKELGSLAAAQEACTRAVKYDPNNPRNLAALLDVALLQGDKPTATGTFDKLKAVNPENQKLEELEEKVQAM